MKNRIFVVTLVFLAVSLSGCASRTEDSVVVATVNGEPIYLKDLKRELSIMVRRNPSVAINKETLRDLVDTLVKRQLIIQEAMRKDMAREEKFIDTIKAFWEQTLIRDFVNYKNREFERYVFVTDKEVNSYYDELKKKDVELPPLEEIGGKITERIKEKKRTQALEDWLNTRKGRARISINRKLISGQAK